MTEIDGFFLLTKLIKKSNKLMLERICDEKKMNEFEREQFLEEYLKPSYYTPIIGSKMDEEAQFYLLKKDPNVKRLKVIQKKI